MAVYEYTAFNERGKQTKGLIEAESARSARAKLKQKGIFTTTVTESTSQKQHSAKNISLSFSSQRVSTSTLAITTRQLATLLIAGMPLVEALRALGDQIDHVHLRKVLSEITDEVNEGSTL